MLEGLELVVREFGNDNREEGNWLESRDLQCRLQCRAMIKTAVGEKGSLGALDPMVNFALGVEGYEHNVN